MSRVIQVLFFIIAGFGWLASAKACFVAGIIPAGLLCCVAAVWMACCAGEVFA